MEQVIKQRITDIQRGNIPAGYQKAKRIGTFPVEWRQVKIGEFIKFYNEKSVVNNQYPVLTSARSGLFFQKDYFEDQVTTENNIGYNIIPLGFFTYRSRSDDGSFYFNRNTIIDRGVISCFYPVFQFDTEKVDSDYIFICLNELLKEQIFCEVAGTSQLVLSEKMLSHMNLVLPPLEEQRRIAEILGCCDRVIALKKELIAEKKKQKKALMQKLLNPDSGFRLPGFSGEWQKTTIGESGTFVKGKGIQNSQCTSVGFPCVKYGDIYMKYNISFNAAQSFTSESVFSESLQIASGALLFTCSGEDPLEIGKCVLYSGSDYIAVGGDIIVMHPNESISPDFLVHQQYSDDLIKQKSALGKGNSIVHIHLPEIKSLKISLPPTKKEQQAIADILSATDKEIDLLEQELAQQEQKKKSLMQLLLTGIVRV